MIKKSESFSLPEDSICTKYKEYLDTIDGMVYFIPFITTIDYLTHYESKRVFATDSNKLKKYNKN